MKFFIIILILCYVSASPLSKPVNKDDDLPVNKFTERSARSMENLVFTDASGLMTSSQCPLDIELVWVNKMDSGIYTSPVIEHIFNSVNKQIVIPSFHRDLTLLDHDGHIIAGWPVSVQENTHFHTSPLTLDYNNDGVYDVVWVSVDGEVFIVSGNAGQGKALLHAPIHLPKLKVRKKWYVGLDEEFAGDASTIKKNGQTNSEGAGNDVSGSQSDHADTQEASEHYFEEGEDDRRDTNQQGGTQSQSQRQRQRSSNAMKGRGGRGDAFMLDQLFEGLSAEARESMIGILDDNIMSMDTTSANTGNAYARASAYAENDDENAEVLKYMTDKDSEHVFVDAHVLGTPSLADANNDGHEDLVLSVSYFFDEDDFNSFPHRFPHVPEDVSIHNYVAGGMLVYDLHNREVLWSQHLDLTTDSTKLQAFIYSSPTIIDLDGDGELEVVVGTSLGFIYVMRARDGEIKSGFPIFMNEIQARVTVEDVTGDGTLEMIALDHSGNVLCFNSKGEEIWETNIGGFSAQGATFGDVNGDGQMDVLIGTVTGHVWALRGKNGDVLPHFPVKTNGKIIAPLTITNLHSRTHQQAMNERKDAPQRESQTQGRQKESTKTTKTGPVGTTTTERDGLHIVFPSFDGYVYIVNGATGCSNKVDIGEHSYSMVLVDDVLGNGKLDLLVTTMSGNVFCFSTDAPYHPMRAWTSEGQGRNGFTHAAGYHGIAASEETRGHRDVIGKTFPFEFEITDNRAQRLDEKTTNEKTNKNKNKNKNNIDAMDSDATGEESNTGRNIGDAGVNTNSNNRYHVSLKHGNQVLFSASYEEAGVYIEQVPTLSIPMTARLSLEMTNEHQQLFTDRFTLSFNLGFYKLIKWLLVLPFALLCFLLIFVKSLKTQLPL